MAIDIKYLLSTPDIDSTPIRGENDGDLVVGKDADTVMLGCGIRRPFQRDLKGDVANVCGVPLVQSAIGQILGTRAQGRSTTGEIPWRPEFGSIVQQLRHSRLSPVLEEVARTYVIDAITRWEPRVAIIDAIVERDDENAKLVISVLYNVLSGPGRSTTLASNIFERVEI